MLFAESCGLLRNHSSGCIYRCGCVADLGNLLLRFAGCCVFKTANKRQIQRQLKTMTISVSDVQLWSTEAPANSRSGPKRALYEVVRVSRPAYFLFVPGYFLRCGLIGPPWLPIVEIGRDLTAATPRSFLLSAGAGDWGSIIAT